MIEPKVEQITILIAEPNRTLGAIYHRILSNEQFNIQVCHDAESLKSCLANTSPQVLVISTVIVLANHGQTLSYAGRKHPGLSIITIGQWPLDEDVGIMLRSGITRHIAKSTSRPSDIVSAVHDLVYA